MTSTTYNRYVDPATDESKTVSFNESPGETNASSNGGHKGWGVRVLRAINDLLPVKIRPVQSRRAHRRRWVGVGHALFTLRMHWKSHHKNKIKKCLNLK
jgi:hypothetical protein